MPQQLALPRGRADSPRDRGRNYYQEWGHPAQELHEGKAVTIAAGVKHWHGAARDSWFVHLAGEIHPEKGPATGLEPVADDEYNTLP